MPKPVTPKAGRLSIPALLFVHYISGQIADASWTHFMQAFDAADATPEERQALASFYRDALGELGPESVKLPRRRETTELLNLIRVS